MSLSLEIEEIGQHVRTPDSVNGYRPEMRFLCENLTAADVKQTLGLLILSCPFEKWRKPSD